MFDQETVKLLISTIQQAAKPKVLELPESKGRYGIATPDGNVNLCLAHPDFRTHVAADLNAVVQFAERFCGPVSDDGSVAPNAPVIWYGRDGVFCLINDADRRDRVTLSLESSVPMAQLEDWQGAVTTLDQAKAVRILRTTFADCLQTAPDLLETLRKVKLVEGKELTGDLQQGKASLGNAIRSEVSGAKVLPEYVTFMVPVFAAGVKFLAPVKAALEVFHGTGNPFAFIPLPGEIEAAFVAAEAWIGEQLMGMVGKDSAIPVYYGKPE